MQIVFLLFLWSMSTAKDPAPADIDFTGTYGTCVQDDSGKILLEVLPDSTFRFEDQVMRDEPVSMTGKWRIVGRYLMLDYDGEAKNLAKKWRFGSDDYCLKARSNLMFLRLCSCDDSI